MQFKPIYFKIALIVAVFLLMGYMVLIFIGENGYQDLNAMKQKLHGIQAKNKEIEQQNVDIYRKIDRIKTDPVYMENIAREELKMIGKKEMVFKFNDDKAQTHNTTPAPAQDTLPAARPVAPESAPLTSLAPLPPPDNSGPSPQD